LLGASARSISPGFDVTKVKAAYDVLPVLEASLGTIIFGILVYLRWDWLHALLGRIRHFETIGPEAWYRRVLEALPRLAARQTRLLQHGSLPRYLLCMVAVVTVLIIALLLWGSPAWHWPEPVTLTIPVLAASALIAFGALATLNVYAHLVLLLVSGLVGYGSAVLFLFTGAPDLAFTQFVVETVFVVVVATVLVRLRRFSPEKINPSEEPRLRPLPLAVASAFGATLTVLVLLVSGLPFDSMLTDFYAEQSLPVAHGRNVVNLILVDFRALDTLGEISVLMFALVAALPLLKLMGEKHR